MTSMVEVVARAIEHEYALHDPLIGPNWQTIARAAIAAMREPSKAMGEIGAPMMAWRALGGGPLDPIAHASEVYRAMIDAALNE